MPKWVLYCTHCKNSFAHSEVVAPPSYDPFYLAPKPDFPKGGLSLTCSHCKRICLSAASTRVLHRGERLAL